MDMGEGYIDTKKELNVDERSAAEHSCMFVGLFVACSFHLRLPPTSKLISVYDHRRPADPRFPWPGLNPP
jgi:hypothetical protein